ncbi:phosphatidylserine decarboxylase proenzyme 1, mitochondrial [Phalaenopsis equestris]|uniref:phosphatidylserine decarboxylase proenzyme 1, mitochondrial n=1 Tax=Phalaenopsis equestris TaxID=78828 RepID=UPI0009E3D012|nr:phosphatidylserine decarboxylase proenzyme 1, mitochondrial [Phalaenopsis equestris]XP_020587299.1 phosphatidylserine decarboxylase proenzyme 1, mitochondrial [Phalaenopsis equestris]
MKPYRVSQRWSLFSHHLFKGHRVQSHYLRIDNLARKLHSARSSIGGGGNGNGEGNFFLVPGATVATLLMLGFLHARRLYEDKKVDDVKEKGIELEFSPDVKATFLRLLPLRSISRVWGYLASLDIPVRLRPSIYKAWARAFHADLEEAALPLEEYTSLQDFFIRSLKSGSRPIDPDSNCLVSPVDGTVLRHGELSGPGALIEQVKGFSYSAYSLLGATTFLHEIVDMDALEEHSEHSSAEELHKKSWWRISLASPKIRHPISARPRKGVYYCVLYLSLGDYHRVHSPVDWQVLLRRHFSGRLFPLNKRATRTIRNLHIENERVILEGRWREGFMAMAAIGATNIGSIKLYIEPELKTNRPKRQILHTEPPDEKIYEPEGVGLMIKKGEEVAAFNMGSTVVLVFQAPVSDFHFCIRSGDRIKAGEAIGRWTGS